MHDFTALTSHHKFRKRRFWHKFDTQLWHRSHLASAQSPNASVQIALEEYRRKQSPEAFVAVWESRVMSTGGKCPYHYLIKPDGDIWLLVPHHLIAPHAGRANKRALGIAIERDMRKFPPSEAQWNTAKELARSLYVLGLERVGGHTELYPSKSNPLKVCPGQFLNLNLLRASAQGK